MDEDLFEGLKIAQAKVEALGTQTAARIANTSLWANNLVTYTDDLIPKLEKEAEEKVIFKESQKAAKRNEKALLQASGISTIQAASKKPNTPTPQKRTDDDTSVEDDANGLIFTPGKSSSMEKRRALTPEGRTLSH